MKTKKKTLNPDKAATLSNRIKRFLVSITTTKKGGITNREGSIKPGYFFVCYCRDETTVTRHIISNLIF